MLMIIPFTNFNVAPVCPIVALWTTRAVAM